MTQTTPTNLPDYERPPVIEVVYGVKFAPLERWKIPHVGAFWKNVEAEFPRCEHAPPIGTVDIADVDTGFPLPRIWLINEAEDRLIQLQPGRFLFNWRSRDPEQSYPRYNNLSKIFFDLLRKFREFLDLYDLGDIDPTEYELTYINHVVEQKGWELPSQVDKIMEEFVWRENREDFLPKPSKVTWEACFNFSEGPGDLIAKLSPARRARDGTPLLVFDLSARGLPDKAPLENMENWFSHAHEWIIRGFDDLTTLDAQIELWGKHA